mmetsp:Transcript_9576/g.29829  ORF Transcript_9576/g.29829 Transcript_9576/m.29829 type:complete len:209 (-) Transcript_9576:243-869(-)
MVCRRGMKLLLERTSAGSTLALKRLASALLKVQLCPNILECRHLHADFLSVGGLIHAELFKRIAQPMELLPNRRQLLRNLRLDCLLASSSRRLASPSLEAFSQSALLLDAGLHVLPDAADLPLQGGNVGSRGLHLVPQKPPVDVRHLVPILGLLVRKCSPQRRQTLIDSLLELGIIREGRAVAVENVKSLAFRLELALQLSPEIGQGA